MPEKIIAGQHGYYVTVKDGSRTGWLAGPFTTRARADAVLPEAKHMAGGNDDTKRAWWYSYGVSRVLDQSKPARVIFPNL